MDMHTLLPYKPQLHRQQFGSETMNSHKPIRSVFSAISVIIISLINSFQVAQGAPSSARVQSFPGYGGNLHSEIYSGYVTVDEAHGRELFYYFVESERNPAQDPLLLWLTGGPGCSGFSALVFEIGPFNFDLTNDYGDLPRLHRNPHSWTKVSNIIFLDSPVGTGYSYSDTTEDYQTGDFKTVSDLYRFFIKWLEEYPEFLSNPTYVGGDSYAGYYVPLLAQKIVNGIQAGARPTLNFKGYLVGNGGTDAVIDNNGKVPFAHGMGLISDELYQAAKDHCKGNYVNPTDPACLSKLQEINKNLFRLNAANILDPICFFTAENLDSASSQEKQPEMSKPLGVLQQFPAARRRMSARTWFPIGDGYLPLKPQHGLQDNPCGTVSTEKLAFIWANNPSVRKAIHAQTEEITGVWQRCSFGRYPYENEVQTVVKYHLNLTRNGYRALIYSGDHDMLVPFVGTQAWIRSLGYAIVDEWQPWLVDDQVAGYTTGYENNLTYATIKGAGHIAPEYKPWQAFVMYNHWISEEHL